MMMMMKPSLLALLLAGFTCLTSSHPTTNAPHTYPNPTIDPALKTINTTILILGGGMTGITAARTLLNDLSNPSLPPSTSLLVLEARGELGGRMQNTVIGARTNNPVPIEFGANWIQSLGDNPIYALAKKYNVKNVRSEWGSLDYFGPEGWEGTEGQGGGQEGELARQLRRFEEVVMPLASAEAGRREELGLPDLSMKAGLRVSAGWVPQTAYEKAVEYFFHDWEMGETPGESSFVGTVNSHNETFVESGSEENNLVVGELGGGAGGGGGPKGFKEVVVGQAGEIAGFWEGKVMFGKTVVDVEYSQDGVVVRTEDGWTVYADYALCTFSLGVLQHDDVTFHPPLPAWKQEAYAQSHMSTYTKIFAQFPYKFWNSTQLTLRADSTTRGHYPVFQSLDEAGFLPGSHVYFATLTGTQAHRAELQTDAEVQREFMAVLRGMYGADIPDPTDFMFPRWTLDPLFRGSFSSWGVGVTEKMQDDMRADVGGEGNSRLGRRLFFAGEHTSRKWFGYLQGAYWEGRWAAHRIRDCVVGGCVEREETRLVKRMATETEVGNENRLKGVRRRMWA